MDIIQKTFNFGLSDNQVRMSGSINIPWFCCKNVATILGYSNHRDALKKHVDIDDKTTNDSILKGYQNATTLNKNDLISIYI
jgi:anti-repressor protein